MASTPDHVDDEMHELNQEADYLDQTVTVDHNGVSGNHKRRSVAHDTDAQAQVIESLRTQVQDLFSQVTQLNGKLVRSYDRVSDLEDELHVTSANLRNTTLKVSQLELERTEHLSALSTGLLVEKDHVTTELNRLMEKATEEAARAGEAESARVAIEKDLDDLSANLFSQANTMVAEARLARAQSERKVTETERALRGAEEVVGVLQVQMQSLQAEKEQTDKRMEDLRLLVGKGKWVERPPQSGMASEIHFLSIHTPYGEYIQFIGHLRTIRPATQIAPAMSTLLPLPFLSRLLTEDSDPTVRLDLAPSLNWLTRRSVLSAIHSGQLNVEPMSTATLLEELSAHATSGPAPSNHIPCALCGTNILDTTYSSHPSQGLHSPTRNGSFGKTGWGSSFLKTSLQTISQAPFGQPGTQSSPNHLSEPPAQVYIFRLESTASSGLPSLPIASQQQGAQTRTATIYPLCSSGWCLARLRTTCSLWAFIRTSIVEKIWEDEPYVPPPHPESPHVNGIIDRPATPVKKARLGIGALWGTMSRSLTNAPPEKPEPSKPAEESSKETKPPVPQRRMPPPPPPRHPSHSGPYSDHINGVGPPPPPPPRRHPPANGATSAVTSEIAAPTPVHPPSAVPPPLPKRNVQRTASPAPAPQSQPEEEIKEETEPVPADHDDAPAMLSPPEELHDEFTTPVEELPAHPTFDVSHAATIPLPPSGPPTPVHAVFTTSRPPSRASTPVQDSVSTQPAGAAVPPPLPRRAAGRARPTSMGLNPPITAPAPETQLVEPVNEKHDVTVSETSPPSPPESESKAQEESEERVEPITNGVTDGNIDNGQQEQHAPASQETTSDEVVEAPQRAESPQQELTIKSQPEDVTEAVNDGKGTAIDSAVYVGTATWEERTWRELMKLREEMFWARVGGVR